MSRWRRWLVPLLLLGLGVGLSLLFGYRSAVRPFGQTVPEDSSQEVRGSTTVGQTFVAPFDGLNRVDVYLSPGGRANTKDVILHIRATPDAVEDLRSDVVSAATVKSDGWVRFEFSRIADSGGKSYYLLLESPTSTAGNTLSVFRSRQDRYRDGVFYLNGAGAEGDLAFQIYSQTGPVGWARGLAGLLAQDKPSIWGEPAFYTALLAGYVILLGVTGVLLAGAASEEGGA